MQYGNYRVTRYFVSLVLLSLMVLLPEASLAADAPNDNRIALDRLTADQRAVQAISRLTFGARPGDFERVRAMGVDAFIAEQLDPENIDDSALQKRLDRLPTLNLPTPVLAEQYNPPKPKPTPSPTPSPAAGQQAAGMTMEKTPPDPSRPVMMPEAAVTASAAMSPTPSPSPTPVPKNPQMVITELQRAKLLRAVYSQRQLGEVMVDFWENHFSIFGNKDATRWMMTAFDRESIRPFAMGRFRDLLGATAHSPAMLFYLDNWQSSLLREYPATKDKPARKNGGINENYARELMELHTLGVGGGYTQKDVQEVARCFTGWGIRKPNEEGLFVYNPNAHDNGEKTVLGVKIPAGGGISDGERVLDILAKNPATARFIATKLARRFLGDNPPAAVIDHAAKAFLATDGSITETVRSIITSPGFWSAASYRVKVKSPFEYVASALRATNAETDANRPVLDWIARMGQPVYGRLTPDGYPDTSTEWLSNNDLLARFNFATALMMNNIKGTNVDAGKLLGGETDAAKTAAAVERTVILGEVSDKTHSALIKLAQDPSAVSMIPASAMNVSNPAKPVTGNEVTGQAEKQAKARDGQLLALALGSPEFQRK